MKDRIPTQILDNGAVRYGVYDEQGTLLRYEYIRPEDEPTEEGTPLSKGSLLKDATAALFGLGNNAVPDDVLAALGMYKHHWWSVLHAEAGIGYGEVRTDVSTYFNVSGSGVTAVTVSKTITIDQTTGTVSLDSPESFGLNTYPSDNQWNALSEKLNSSFPCYLDINGDIYYFPDGSTCGTSQSNDTIYAYRDSGDDRHIRISDRAAVLAQTVKSRIFNIPPGETTYVHSSDRSAYPDSGKVEGLTYAYLGIPLDNAITATAIKTGSYMGTGTYGVDNPNTLELGFAPSALIIGSNPFDWSRTSGSVRHVYFAHKGADRLPVTKYSGASTVSGTIDMIFDWGETSVSWYLDGESYHGAAQQFNTGKYYYIAFRV